VFEACEAIPHARLLTHITANWEVSALFEIIPPELQHPTNMRRERERAREALSHGEHVFLMRANKIYTRPRREVISRCAWYYSRRRRLGCLYMHPSTCFCGGGGGRLPESIISLTSFHSDTDNMTARGLLSALSHSQRERERVSECMRPVVFCEPASEAKTNPV
jgi:hypothetical protein